MYTTQHTLSTSTTHNTVPLAIPMTAATFRPSQRAAHSSRSSDHLPGQSLAVEKGNRCLQRHLHALVEVVLVLQESHHTTDVNKQRTLVMTKKKFYHEWARLDVAKNQPSRCAPADATPSTGHVDEKWCEPPQRHMGVYLRCPQAWRRWGAHASLGRGP
jgi:hypothetical protein